MIHVDVEKESKFPVSSKKIKDVVTKTLTDNGIVSDAEVSVVVVKRSTMQEYVDKYYDDKEDHPVLSFPSQEVEGQFVFPPNEKLYLGEIIISYDWCVDEAARRSRIPEDLAIEMAEHGSLHLLGIHHD